MRFSAESVSALNARMGRLQINSGRQDIRMEIKTLTFEQW
jgi:hypothetical protein